VDGLYEHRVVAMYGDKIAGTVAVTSTLKLTACIRQLYVDSGIRKHGVGTDLVNRCIGLAIEDGCVAVSLNLAKNNIGVAPFYMKLGFTLAYQFDDGDMILTKSLKPWEIEAQLKRAIP
jgi:GNAT superfamily N-acetyltransferase